MPPSEWLDLGPAEQFARRPVTEITLGRTKLAVTHRDGIFGVISGVCNHVGGPLGQGRLEVELAASLSARPERQSPATD